MHEDAAQPERYRAVADAIGAALREVGGPELYRRNAFRLTGLPTDAGRPAVRHRQRQVLPALRVGADIDLGHDLPVTPEDVSQAFNRILEDPRRRLVDELFWLWGDADSACGCTRRTHVDHDAAIRAHCAVLDAETAADPPPDDQLDELEQLWDEAARLWGQLLGRAAFWDHVRYRIAALDERQLDESVIELLREQLPITLVRPLVVLAMRAADGDEGWLAELARRWPVPAPVIDDQLADAAKPLYHEVESATTAARQHCLAARPVQAATIVYDEVLPKLTRLTALVPPDRHRRTASARDGAATVLNNATVALFDRDGTRSHSRVRQWLASAGQLASDPHTVSAIAANRTALNEAFNTLKEIRRQVDQLVALGRPDVARRLLRDVQRRARGAAGAGEIDRMLAELGVRTPARPGPNPRAPVPVPRRSFEEDNHGRPRVARREAGRWFGRLVAAVAGGAALYGAVVLLTHWLGPSLAAPVATVYAESVADNAPVGTCLVSEDGWNGDLGGIPVSVCDREHWGEVLGYVRLGAVPSPYPGRDQAHALAGFRCRQLLVRQDLPAGKYVVSHTFPEEDVWNDGGKRFENYATCVVHRADGRQLPGKRLVDPGRDVRDPEVRMDLFNSDVGNNPPVGTCVLDEQSFDTSVHDVPVIDCARQHWAEILGYPTLYGPGVAWPGDAVVQATARQACGRLAGRRGLPGAFQVSAANPGPDWRNSPTHRIYAVCVVSRADNHTFWGTIR